MNTHRSAARRLTCKAAIAAVLATGLWPGIAAAETWPAAPPARAAEPPLRHHVRCAEGADAFKRIELFFGLSRPGGVVSEDEFKGFVDASVTPRFPDGLTLLAGSGQFRNASGAIVVEGSKLLILLVPLRDPQADAKAEAVRSDYRQQFQQESVLRSDTVTCASF